jgi:hypothetical protein
MQKKLKKCGCRSTYHLCKYILMTCALMAAGCAQQTSTPSTAKLPDENLYVEQDKGAKKAYLMKVAEDVLAEMHFTIEKADVKNGLIRTKPLPGAQFFEFWRSDNVGIDNALAANIHTIRRFVTIDINQQGPQMHIVCEVHAQRLSLPERPVNSSSGVYGMFSQSSPLLQRLILNPEQAKQMTWTDLGRDSRLEAKITRRIETRIQRQASRRLQTLEIQL